MGLVRNVAVKRPVFDCENTNVMFDKLGRESYETVTLIFTDVRARRPDVVHNSRSQNSQLLLTTQ